MIALREEDLSGALAAQRKVDDLLLGLDAALDCIATLASAVEVLTNGLGQLLEPDDRERLHELVGRLREPDNDLTRIREAAGRSKSLGADALDDFIQRLQQSKKGEWIEPGRPRPAGDKQRRLPADKNVVQIDPDGRVWGQTIPDAGDPLAGLY